MRRAGTSWAPTGRRQNKYRAQPVVIDGQRFASKREGARWCELRLLERAGEIDQLQTQVSFPCVVEGVKVCSYIADFVYRRLPTGDRVVEDAKGMKTPVYRLKKKLVKACLGIDVHEV